MPITLTLEFADDHREEFRLEDGELRAAWAAREDADLAIVALQRHVERRLAQAYGVEPAGRDDRDTIRRLLLWLVGLYILGNAFTYVMQYLMAGIAQRTVGWTTSRTARVPTWIA